MDPPQQTFVLLCAGIFVITLGIKVEMFILFKILTILVGLFFIKSADIYKLIFLY